MDIPKGLQRYEISGNSYFGLIRLHIGKTSQKTFVHCPWKTLPNTYKYNDFWVQIYQFLGLVITWLNRECHHPQPGHLGWYSDPPKKSAWTRLKNIWHCEYFTIYWILWVLIMAILSIVGWFLIVIGFEKSWMSIHCVHSQRLIEVEFHTNEPLSNTKAIIIWGKCKTSLSINQSINKSNINQRPKTRIL